MEILSPEEYRKYLRESLKEIKNLYRSTGVKCDEPKICECVFLKQLGQVYKLSEDTKNKAYLNVFDSIIKDYYNFIEKAIDSNHILSLNNKGLTKIIESGNGLE